MKSSSQTRRAFLKKSALITSSFFIVPSFVLGKEHIAPSDKIALGFIGTGKQGRGLGKRFAALPQFQVVGGCDVERQKLKWWTEILAEQYAQARGQNDFKGLYTTSFYEEMIARSDVDAVVVATPDHQHAGPSIAAMKAGKHVFCEKPLSHTLKEGRMMVKAAEKYDRILQTGSMQRSRKGFLHACELVRNGYIGKVSKVLVNVGDPAIPCDLPDEQTPTHVNWDRWLGPAPMRAFSSVLSPPVEQDIFPKWRDYAEYGGGIIADWGAHMFDIAQWGLGMDDTGPVEYIPPSDPTATRGLRMIYANGIEMVHEDFGRGFAVRFIGSEGTLDVSRQFLETTPEKIASAEIKKGETRLYKSENHYIDWADSIKNHTQPICPAEVGHRSASICHIANIAYQLQRPLRWDPVKEKFEGDSEANKKRSKKYRSGYKV